MRTEKEKCCGMCTHYCWHYIRCDEKRFVPIWYGHCVLMENKIRKPNEMCAQWSGAEPEKKTAPQEIEQERAQSYPIKWEWT